MNVTVTAPSGQGHLQIFPAGSPLPPASFLNFTARQARANNGLLSLGDSGAIAVFISPTAGSAHVIVGVSGDFE